MGCSVKISKIVRVLIFILLLSCYNEENFYIVDENILRKSSDDSDKINVKLNFSYPDELIIISDNDESDGMVLEKIKLYYKNELINETEIKKSISKLSKNADYNRYYTLKNILIEALGENNEKYSISSGRFMESDFLMEVEIKDRRLGEKYILKKDLNIIFRKKGFKDWSISI